MPTASTDISGSNQSYTLTLTKNGTSWSLTATHNGSTSYGAWGTATGTVTGASASPSSYSKGYDFTQYNSLTVASGSCSQYGTITATFNGNNSPYIGSGSVSVTESQPTPTYSHTLTYNANGGSNAPSPQTKSTTTQGSFSQTLSSTIPTRDRYEFLGWSLSASGSPDYLPGQTYTFNTQNATLYAIWKGLLLFKDNDEWVAGTLWYKNNGEWAEGQIKKKVSNVWR